MYMKDETVQKTKQLLLYEDETKFKDYVEQEELNVYEWAEVVKYALEEEEVPLETFKSLINMIPGDIKDDLFLKQIQQHDFHILYYAVLVHNPKKLEIVIDECREVIWLHDLNATALHVLSEQMNFNLEEKHFLECAEILLSKGLDVNLRDDCCLTPIDIAIRGGNVDLIKFLLKVNGVDIDTHFWDVESGCEYFTAQSRSPREQIEELNISTDKVQHFSANNQLYSYLSSNSEDKFIELCEDMDTVYCCNFFLEVAITRNLKKITKYLYKRDLGHYRKINIIQRALLKNNFDLFKDLLSYADYDSRDLFLQFNFQYDDDPRKRYEFLMGFYEADKNFLMNQDVLQYLHNLQENDILLDLLKRGVPLLTHTAFNEPLFRDIRYDVLETYLDSCVSKKEEDRKNEIYILDYTNIWLDKDPFGQKKVELSPEYEIMSFVANFMQYRNLLKHPMLTVLINEKWKKVSHFFYVNFALQITLFILALIFLSSYCHEEAKSIVLLIFLFILNSISSTSELMQLLVAPRQYLWEFENWVDMLINTLVFAMLFTESQETTTKLQISSALVTAIAFKMLFLLGKFHIFARNSAMFQTVSLEYVKFLLFFSVLLIGFSFSFHFLFGFHQENGDLFQTWYLSIFRTLIMLTGELNSSDIDFSSNSFSTYIIFIVFMFSIVTILSNLLNGLAISDVEKIKNDADMLILLSRINYIYNVETRIYKQLPMRSLKKYLKKKTAVFTNSRRKKVTITEKCQCPVSFHGYKNYVNRERHNYTCKFFINYFEDMVSVDKKILSNAKYIVVANKETQYTEEKLLQKTVQIGNSQIKLDKIENAQRKIEEKLSALQNKYLQSSSEMAARMEKLESLQQSILRLLETIRTEKP